MATWKRLRSVTQSFSHHLQSGLSFIQPHVSDELRRNEIYAVEISLLPSIAASETFTISDSLALVLQDSILMFRRILAKEGFSETDVVSLSVRIEQKEYLSRDSKIVTAIVTENGRVVSGMVDYIIYDNRK